MQTSDIVDAIWGAEAIALAAGIVRPDGSADTRKTFYMLEQGYLPGRKVGRLWVSSRAAITRALAPAQPASEEAL